MKVLLKILAVAAVLILAAGLFFYLRPLAVNDAILHFGLWRKGVRSRTVHLDGRTIHYFEADPPTPNAAPLVLVHGLGDRSEAWAPVIPQFAAAGFHVYALDLMGYGESSTPTAADYSVGYEADVLAGFMRALGIAHADVAGASMGGWIVLELGLNHPELARRLVVYDSAGIYFEPTWDPSLFHPRDPASLVEFLDMLSVRHPRYPGFVVRDILRTIDRRWWVVDRGLTAMRTGRDLLDFRLGSITQPTLLVWGAKDALIPASVGERMHRAIPHSQFQTVAGCGHLAPTECSAEVLRDTLAFLHAE